MKKSPQQQKLEGLLQSSKFSACGFMGSDGRSLWEIIDEDAAVIARAGKTMEEIAARMKELTDEGVKGLGDWVEISKTLKVMVDDNRGMIPCPWPHHVRCLKRITYVRSTLKEKEIRWSDLSVHLIKEHGFFQGRGSPYRVDPDTLIKLIFTVG
ncbi:MAG: hypothetical protein JSU64_00110 [candidate division WOR-3 bacterium]|nr:MAG: hypothetical protein JSU64_00110 [candidate division WOR-3 bacterium]